MKRLKHVRKDYSSTIPVSNSTIPASPVAVSIMYRDRCVDG